MIAYSDSVDKIIDYNELSEHLYYLANQPKAIPYITSYYSKEWGFCMTYEQFKSLNKKSKYRVFIDIISVK